MAMYDAIRDEAKILIVDDLEDNIYILEGMLGDAGYSSYKSTTDPREVISLYMEYKPDIVLLDLEMPYIDGFEVMKMLKEVEHGSYTPVIVLTARSEREIKLKALQGGARDFIVKPFDEFEVETRIRNQLEVRLLHNQIKNQNVILEEKVRDRTKELHGTRLEIIRKLGIAAEFRDKETGGHIVRISRMSEKLALAAGLDPKKADMIMNASPMHDVGKIGIRDSILLKPGKLTPDEFEEMKQHTIIGAEILGNDQYELLKTARVIALTHHEKWDGSGYPKGLKGESIPIEGRITAVVDVFDALTSKRSYKEAWPVEKALEEMDRISGTHFGPSLIEAFHKIMPEILEIKNSVTED
jgi:putative two-component system response regulator